MKVFAWAGPFQKCAGRGQSIFRLNMDYSDPSTVEVVLDEYLCLTMTDIAGYLEENSAFICPEFYLRHLS